MESVVNKTKYLNHKILACLLYLLLFCSIYGEDHKNTLAVLGYWSDIENEEIRAMVQYGLPDYMNDYFYYHSDLQLADRMYINEATKEILLSQSNFFDENTYIEKGKQLNVRYLVFGYGVIAEGSSEIQTITRVYDFDTQVLLGPLRITKPRANDIGPQLTEEISELLRIVDAVNREKLTKLWNVDESAFRNYSMGLKYEITGDIVKSDMYMKEALKTSGSFFKAIQKSQYYHNYLNKIFDNSYTARYTPFVFGHTIFIDDTTEVGEDTTKLDYSSFGGNMMRISWRGRSGVTEFSDLSLGIGTVTTYSGSRPLVIALGVSWGKVKPSWYLNKYYGPNIDLFTYFSGKEGNLFSIISGYVTGFQLFPTAKARLGVFAEASPNILLGIKVTKRFDLEDFYIGIGGYINFGLAYRYGGI